eukprot:CAMPEP_0119270274 /NCGR_PEP_ID=MMETSP1329-20130426/7342_1 /TAXON_ID=114041 /ORGANISM="Genus nov. species nov., Strain RCC1024" /LENGTH=395 /DNA_ID=CAMNT_0007270291 /DNA_START=193 /DNA_END=1377 /DNA_ORIENTATION=+
MFLTLPSDGTPAPINASDPEEVKPAPPIIEQTLPLQRMRKWMNEFTAARARLGGGWPTIRTVRRDATNVELDDGDDGTPESLTLGSKRVTKTMTPQGKRSYTGILYVMSYCRDLRERGVTSTQREVYYHYKGKGPSPWRTQAECNESIADVAGIFGVPRFALGLTTAARGQVAGLVKWRSKEDSTWTDPGDKVQPVDHGWLTDAGREVVSDGARCVLVVEKDGVFQRLVQDKFFREGYPSILVTASGIPDMATRAFVHRLRATLGLPVFGLVDYNAWGVGVLLTYKVGSARLGVEARRFAVDIKWLGLRGSQVERYGVPEASMQPLTDRDRRRAENLLVHPWVAEHPRWEAELQDLVDGDAKCEIEALVSCVPDSANEGLSFHAISTFVREAIVK